VTALPTWVAGATIAAVIALLALRLHALRPSGAAAAWLSGSVAVAAGWDWGLYLVVYFVAASALSRYRATEKARLSQGRVARSGARDAVQVAANGGVYVIAASAYLLDPGATAIAAGAGALAASAADTWGTEIGSLSRMPPRSIVTFARVLPGTSGGVTLLGLTASLAASLFAAAIAMLVGWPGVAAVAAIIGGMIGSLSDSLLGATVQARWWCDSCAGQTERRIHGCGLATRHVGGWRWLNNNGVNLAATVAGAAAGAVCAFVIRG
jgi:uncharacterized protein (TIGR00297 family)